MKIEHERLLVIAPHPDDEVLGCFGLINKVKENGGKTYVLVLTIGGYSKVGSERVKKEEWRREFLKVAQYMKIDEYDIAFYENKIRYLDTVPQKRLIDLLESKSKISIEKIKPTIVAIPTIFSTHQDHVQAYKVAISALRAHPHKTRVLPNLVISYESPEYYFWSAYSEFGKFSPNLYLQMSKNDMDNKITALSFYKSQLKEGQRDGSRTITLASIRGSEVGTEYAEAYHMHRFLI